MADTVSVNWIYPPGYGDAPNPPDKNGWKRVCIQLLCLSDGTGETDVTKLDISTLKTTSGNVPTATSIEWIEYETSGLTAVLEWERSPHKIISIIGGNNGGSSGKKVWSESGGNVDTGLTGDGTGNILLTTYNASVGDSYDITMSVSLKD